MTENLLLVIKESLINETSITHIGITLANEQTGTFTSGYKTYNSSIPSTFFSFQFLQQALQLLP